MDRATIIQVLGPYGAVLWTGYVPGNQELPSWEQLRINLPVVEEGLAADGQPVSSGPSPLLYGGIGTAVLAAGTYGYALSLKAQFDDPETDYAELESLQGKTNAAVYAAGGLGGVAVVLTVLSFRF